MTATIFPPGHKPFILMDTLPAGSEEVSAEALGAHINAVALADFHAAVPVGATRFFLTFVAFAYPNAEAPRQAPIVELLGRDAGFNGLGAILRPTPGGTDSAALGGGQFVNYSYVPLGRGLFRIVLTEDNVPLQTVRWLIRFTVNDGVTSAATPLGLTFSVGPDASGVGWLAVPGQPALELTGPPPIDMGGAVRGITLAGAEPADPLRPLLDDRSVTVAIPIGNYGTAPLVVMAATPAAAGNFAMKLAAPLVVPPGGCDTAALTLTYHPPEGGEVQPPDAATGFILETDDPLAAASGALAHFDTLAVHASSIAVPRLGPSPQFAPVRGVALAELESGELVGSDVVLFGRHLDGAVSAVFGEVPADSIAVVSGGLRLGVPALDPGTVPITVTTGAGSVTTADLFTVSPLPEITDFHPFTFGDHGDSPAGRDFTIEGARFVIAPDDRVSAVAVLGRDRRHEAPPVVLESSVSLEILSFSATQIAVRAGPAPDFFGFIGGTVTIRVVRSDGGVATMTASIEGM